VTLAAYLARVLGLRMAGAGALLLALGLSIDLIKTADELIATGGATALMHYAALRLPQMLTTVLPLAVLIGAVLGFMRLARSSEIAVMRAAGLGVFALLLRLVPLAVGLGLVHHLLVDRASAWSERALADAFGPVIDLPAPEPGTRIAMRGPSSVIVARLARGDGTALAPAAVYALDAGGQVAARIEIESAEFIDGRWRLSGLESVAPARRDRISEAGWPVALTPATVRMLARGAGSATAGESAAALADRAVATRSTAYYRTRIARSRAALAVPAAMLVLAAAAGFGLPRGGQGLGHAALGTAAGFGYVALDGLFVSFGESGILAASVAAYAPTGLALLAGSWVLLMIEE